MKETTIEFTEAELVLLFKVLNNVSVTGISEMQGMVTIAEKVRVAAVVLKDDDAPSKKRN